MSKLHKNEEYFSNIDWTVEKVNDEVNSGLALLNKIDKPTVTFFGSHRVTPESKVVGSKISVVSEGQWKKFK